MLWIIDWQQWVVYQDSKELKGCFKPIYRKDFRKVVRDWIDSRGLRYSPKMVTDEKDRLEQDWSVELRDFDTDLNIRNVLNGFLNLKTKKLTPHTNTYLSLRQASVIFKQEKDIQSTPRWKTLHDYYPEGMPFVEWYLKCIIFNNMSDEKALFIVGAKRGGKGSVTKVLKQFFSKDMISNVDFSDIAIPFLLAHCAGKNINCDQEGDIAPLKSRAVKNFKTIVGQDGDITVNPKGKSPFDCEFMPFFFWNACNLLRKLPPTDPSSFFVRVAFAVFKDKPVKTDPNFKPELLLEADDIFSKLVYSGWEPFTDVYKRVYNKEYEEEPYIKETKATWDLWSDPVIIACKALFLRDNKGVGEMPCKEIYEMITAYLSDNDYSIPVERSIILKTTSTLKKMNIVKRRRAGNEYVYTPIEVISGWVEPIVSKGTPSIEVDEIENKDFKAEDYADDFFDFIEEEKLFEFSYREIEKYQEDSDFSQKQCFQIVKVCEEMEYIKKNGKKWQVITV